MVRLSSRRETDVLLSTMQEELQRAQTSLGKLDPAPYFSAIPCTTRTSRWPSGARAAWSIPRAPAVVPPTSPCGSERRRSTTLTSRTGLRAISSGTPAARRRPRRHRARTLAADLRGISQGLQGLSERQDQDAGARQGRRHFAGLLRGKVRRPMRTTRILLPRPTSKALEKMARRLLGVLSQVSLHLFLDRGDHRAKDAVSLSSRRRAVTWSRPVRYHSRRHRGGDPRRRRHGTDARRDLSGGEPRAICRAESEIAARVEKMADRSEGSARSAGGRAIRRTGAALRPRLRGVLPRSAGPPPRGPSPARRAGRPDLHQESESAGAAGFPQRDRRSHAAHAERNGSRRLVRVRRRRHAGDAAWK